MAITNRRPLLRADAFCILVCLVGCTTIEQPYSGAEPREVRIAKEYVKETTGVEKIEAGPVTKLNSYTSVWVWYLPHSPGGFYIVNVGKDGHIIEVIPGR